MKIRKLILLNLIIYNIFIVSMHDIKIYDHEGENHIFTIKTTCENVDAVNFKEEVKNFILKENENIRDIEFKLYGLDNRDCIELTTIEYKNNYWLEENYDQDWFVVIEIDGKQTSVPTNKFYSSGKNFITIKTMEDYCNKKIKSWTDFENDSNRVLYIEKKTRKRYCFFSYIPLIDENNTSSQTSRTPPSNPPTNLSKSKLNKEKYQGWKNIIIALCVGVLGYGVYEALWRANKNKLKG